MAEECRGFLMLADVSGYTRFLSGVELDHSRDLIANLLGVVIGEARGVMELAKVEGDAVFFFEEGRATPEAMVTLAEAVYFAFRRWRRDVEHLTTCRCEACRRIPDLDLKLILHRGAFAMHEVAGNRELIGPHVILAHRLLKNGVAERTGTRAYALFTDDAAPVRAVDCEADGSSRFVRMNEVVEDMGDVVVHVLDLAHRWDQELERSVFLVPAGSGADVEAELPVAPGVAWDWLADPDRRRRWNGADRIDVENPGGTRGTGTRTHCVHGRRVFDEEIVDWKPHRYVTIRTSVPGGRAVFSVELLPSEPDEDPAGGATTSIRIHIAPDSTGLRGAFVRRVVLPRMRATLDSDLGRLLDLLEADSTTSTESG